MSSLNHPDKVTLDAFSDPQLQTQNANGIYNRYTNRLSTPILNAKSIQLVSANFINSRLQFDDNSQLIFYYYINNTSTLSSVRLHPSNFLPVAGFTTFVRNRYFNTVSDVVAALNQASAVGGDSITFNPGYVAGQLIFSYDPNSRKITVQSTNASMITPAAADDPNVIALQNVSANIIRMNSVIGSIPQPIVQGQSMNARLGFAMSVNTRGIFTASGFNQSAAWSRKVFTSGPCEADANPILLSSQNISFYISAINGSGLDASGRKNLLETVPIAVAPLNIQNFHSLENHAMSVPNEIYEITVEMLDDYGRPFFMPPNYDVSVCLGVFY